MWEWRTFGGYDRGTTSKVDELVNMRQTIARLLVTLVGLFLCFVGVLHDVVNIPSLQRAAARGEIAERMLPQLVANVAFGGATLSLLGLILLVVAHRLRAPHSAFLVVVTVGASWGVST